MKQLLFSILLITSFLSCKKENTADANRVAVTLANFTAPTPPNGTNNALLPDTTFRRWRKIYSKYFIAKAR
jgi:hypothetical protein